MRITILANRDLPALVAVNLLTTRLAEHALSLVLSDSVGRPVAEPPPELVQLKALEQGLINDLLAPMMAGLPDDGTRLRSFEELGAALEAPARVVNHPRSEAGRAAIAGTGPELILSIRYGGILDADHAALARHGILNLHSGRLPEYRGVLASFRALMAGETALTCTLHRIVDAGIDTGPVIATCDLPLLPERTLLTNVLRLYAPGVALLADAVHRLAAGESLPGTPQPEGGHYYGAPDAAELATFAARGFRLADTGEMIEVLRMLLGLDAHPPPDFAAIWPGREHRTGAAGPA